MLTALIMAAALASGAAPTEDAKSLASLRAAGASASKPVAMPSYGPDSTNVGDLRLPPGTGPFPVIVLIHGGCWEAGVGGPQDVAALADALTQRGFATWSIEYRKVGEPGGGWPGTFADVGQAVDYVRVLAKSQPLDLSRVILLGHSSGAHLALWAASRPRLNDIIAGVDPLKPLAVIAIDGPATLASFIGIDAEICGKPAIIPLMGGSPTEKPKSYRLASPAEHLPLGLHQILVLGELAPLMQPYVDAARAAGDSVDALTPSGADHFNILNPSTPAGRQVVDFVASGSLASRRPAAPPESAAPAALSP